jgi:hypothetical protein
LALAAPSRAGVRGHGIDDSWIGPATRFTSGYGHVSMDLPDSKHLRIDRTDFVPDGRAPW